jgi:hypothetical protein
MEIELNLGSTGFALPERISANTTVGDFTKGLCKLREGAKHHEYRQLASALIYE